MRLVNLETVNFKHLSGASGEFSLEFGEGVIGIRGPNESGKSSIMQAVFFALTGQPLEGGREIGHYVRYGASRAVVRLEFEVGGRRYLAERVIKRKKDDPEKGTSDAFLYEVMREQLVKISSGVREVTERVSQLLGGLGAEELRSTVFIIQKDLDRLREKGTKERKELIDSLIGRESFDKAKERLNEMKKELEGTPQRKGRIEKAREELKELERELEEYKKVREELGGVKERITILEGPADQRGSVREQEAVLRETEEKLDILEEYQRRREEIGERIKDLEGKARELQAEIRDLREKEKELREARKALEEVRGQIEALEAPEGVEGSIKWFLGRKARESKLLERLKELRGLRDELVKGTSELKRLHAELERLIERIREKEGLVKRIKSRISELVREREELEEELEDVRRNETNTKYVTAGIVLLGALMLMGSSIMPHLFTLSLLVMLGGFAIYFVWGSRYSQLSKELEGEREACTRELRAGRESLENYERELLSLKDMERELLTAVREWKGMIKGLTRNIKGKLEEVRIESRGEVSLALEDLDRLDELLEERNRKIMELSDQISQARERLNNLRKKEQELEERIEKLSRAPEILKGKEKELDAVRSEIEGFAKEMDRLEKELPEDLRPFSPEMVMRYRELRKKAYGELERRKEELRNLKNMEESLLKRLRELEGIEERVKEAEEKVRELERFSGVVRKALEMLDATAKATREAVRPAIEYGMSTILPVITEGRYGRVRIDEDTFDVEVYDSEAGGYVRLERFSGGTVDQVLLAMRLAFTLSVIPKMKGQHPEFLFMDEVLASSDSQRRKKIMELVTTNLRKHFAQIVAISHQEDVLRYADRHVVMRDGELGRS